MSAWLYQIQPRIEIRDAGSQLDITYVGIVRADFWEANGHFDDSEIGDALREDFPDFDGEEVMEGLFQIDRAVNDTEAYLKELGLSPVE